jgi:hypothetical protein
MKAPRIALLILILFFAFRAVSSFAVLDTTVEECNRRYGEPVEAPYTFEDRGQQRTRYTYHWAGILVRAVFEGTNDTDIRCVGLDYERIPSAPSTGVNKMTTAEIENILALNANGSPWKRGCRGWIRSDGQAFVREFNFTKENAGTRESVRMNSLWVFDEGIAPEIAAHIRADSPTE